MINMACTKRKLKDPLSAKLDVARIELNVKNHRKMSMREEPNRIYKCPECKAWHLTRMKTAV